jgi:hypothetical protein
MHLKYLSTRPNLNSRLGGEIQLTTREKRLKKLKRGRMYKI